MRPLWLALSFLTAVRVPARIAFQPRDFPTSVSWFFVAGLLIGTIQYAVAWALLQTPLHQQLAAIFVVVAGIVITGGLHLDGVADSADGFGAGRDRESILRIMKDDRLGVFGSAAIMLVLFTKITATGLVLNANPTWLVLAPVISRTMLAGGCALLPYARPEGTGRMFVENTSIRHASLSLLACALICFLLSGVFGLLLLMVNIVLCAALLLYFKYRIAGITGDTLGLLNELSEITVLLSAGAAG